MNAHSEKEMKNTKFVRVTANCFSSQSREIDFRHGSLLGLLYGFRVEKCFDVSKHTDEVLIFQDVTSFVVQSKATMETEY